MSNFHGSDIEKIAAQYQIQPESLVNFGVNANPLGLSPRVKQVLASNINLISSYPDPEYSRLKQAISSYLGVDFKSILLGNGTSQLIFQLIQDLAPKSALLYHPTYSEYGREIEKQGGHILSLPLVAANDFAFPYEDYDRAISQVDLVIICNPNNPTATLLKTSQLETLLAKAQQRNIPFIIDETYIEFTNHPPTYSGVSLLKKYPNLVILRGFSKFFAAPGLRLGYSLSFDFDLVRRLENSYPWAISSLAALAGPAFLEDQAYIKASSHYILAERKRIMGILKQIPNLKVYPSEVNFFLAELRSHKAKDLFMFLLNKGFFIRIFHDQIGPGFFRFCLLDQASNDQLLKQIKVFIGRR